MKEFVKYFEELGLGTRAIEIIEKHYSFYKDFLKVEIQDVFVSETIDQEGNRNYLSLWFINERQFMEIKNFLSHDDYDMDNIEIKNWNLEKSNLDDLEKANDKSRIHLKAYISDVRLVDFKSSGNNCIHLLNIFKKYIAQIN